MQGTHTGRWHTSVKEVKNIGVRPENWLTPEQSQRLWMQRSRRGNVTSLGWAIFALLAAGVKGVEEAQTAYVRAILPFSLSRRWLPSPQISRLYRKLYFVSGKRLLPKVGMSDVSRELRSIAVRTRRFRMLEALWCDTR